MQVRHGEVLESRLEEAVLHGCALISWEELYLWYGVQKIAAGTWSDLALRWDKVVESIKALKMPGWVEPGKLNRIDARAGFFIFGDKLVKKVA
jgi:hypothetical protein